MAKRENRSGIKRTITSRLRLALRKW